MAVLFSAVGCSRAPATGDPSAAAGDVEALEREAASLKSQLADTRSRIDDLRLELNSGGSTAVTGNLSTPEIIGELLEIKLTSGNRRAVQRRMGYLFESLAGRGDAAVPHIRGFLNKMEDVDFAIPKSPKDEANELEYWRSRMVRAPLDFECPPSLRIGLIDILSEIGGAQVEEAIAKVLAATGRGFEIAYAANKLRSMIGKDAYRDEAVGAAHELLAEPIHVAGGNKFDAASRQYLFMVLEMYNDKTFIQTAQGMFINEDGKIDRSVLRYFEQVGKEHAFDFVAQAMRSGQLRDREMMELARVAVHSMGKNNPQGDTLFRDIMTSDNYSMDVKMQTIRSMDDLEDQAILQSRLALMDSIHYGEGDIMGRANEIYSGRVQSKMTKGGFRDQKQYDAMHADFRKINEQVKRGQRSGNIQRNVPSGPTIVPSP